MITSAITSIAAPLAAIDLRLSQIIIESHSREISIRIKWHSAQGELKPLSPEDATICTKYHTISVDLDNLPDGITVLDWTAPSDTVTLIEADGKKKLESLALESAWRLGAKDILRQGKNCRYVFRPTYNGPSLRLADTIKHDPSVDATGWRTGTVPAIIWHSNDIGSVARFDQGARLRARRAIPAMTPHQHRYLKYLASQMPDGVDNLYPAKMAAMNRREASHAIDALIAQIKIG